MSADGDDDKPGHGNPPKDTRWKDGQSGNRGRRYPKRAESTVELIDRLLVKPVEITVDGKSRKATTLEAILFRVFQKEVIGDVRALKIRLKFEELVKQYSKPKFETVFVDNEYTAAVAAAPLKGSDDNG